MSTNAYFRFVALLVTLLLCSCEDSTDCPYSPDKIDPPVSDLSVTWNGGNIGANLMPIVPPDPVACQVWLILENKNRLEAFSKVEIPTADVILVRSNSTLGAILFETDWDGLLAPGKKDTIRFFKNTGGGTTFNPPCGERVLMDFKIRNADGDTKIFRSDTLSFQCVY